MREKDKIRAAFKAAFPFTIPILAGFLFLGITYGVYMNVSGFPFIYPMLMSLFIFAGSMEFVSVGLLLGSFHPLQAVFMALMINARHLFYGISMLDRYKDTGRKKPYLIYGLCDETFSVNCTVTVPPQVDRSWFFFFVTLLNQAYWVTGSTLGGLLGSLVSFDTKGMDFVMTALFVVIFLDWWMKNDNHIPSVLGLVLSLLCLLVFTAERFLLPAMGFILLALILLRKPLEKAGERK